MPVFTHDYLHKVAYQVYLAKGTPEEEAEIVATHQVKSNLVGHDSHGIIQLLEYCNRIDRGHIVPGAPFVVERETPNTAVINGNWGFGFVQTEKAMRMAIDKAREHGVAAMTVHHQSHVGRVGDYPTMALKRGHDRPGNRRLRRRPQECRTIRRQGSPPGHQPHLHRRAQRPARAGAAGHGDQRGGHGQD